MEHLLFHPADSTSLLIFNVFSALMALLISMAFLKAKVPARFLIIFFCVTSVFSYLAIVGLIRDFTIPVIPIFFTTLIAMSFVFSALSPGKMLAKRFSLPALVAFQSFRFPLELILHHWSTTRVIPETMTWTGQNFDILSGLLALMLCPFISRYRSLAWCYQIVAFGLLLNVLRVALMSMPLPFSWGLENPLQLAMHFPYVLIGPLFVWPALFGHLVIFRKLLNR